jgi:hypothetical protein
VFETAVDRPTPSEINMTETFWTYDAAGKLVLVEIDQTGAGGKTLSVQMVFVKDDKSVFQIVSPKGVSLSLAKEFPDDGVMQVSDPTEVRGERVQAGPQGSVEPAHCVPRRSLPHRSRVRDGATEVGGRRWGGGPPRSLATTGRPRPT